MPSAHASASRVPRCVASAARSVTGSRSASAPAVRPATAACGRPSSAGGPGAAAAATVGADFDDAGAAHRGPRRREQRDAVDPLAQRGQVNRERADLMAEQLALEQRLGQRSSRAT